MSWIATVKHSVFALVVFGIIASSHAQSTCDIRRVKIQSSTGNAIQVFEVEIYSQDVNVAIGKNATQSSDFDDLFASNAIDGDLETFSHTKDSKAFLEVDLLQEYPVNRISIKNRWCGDVSDPTVCLCRLSSAAIYVFNDAQEIIFLKQLSDTCNQPDITFELSCEKPPIVVASTVKLESTTKEAIQVFELEIFSGGTNVAIGKTATESSIYEPDLVAQNAIDGDMDTYCHTNFKIGEFLLVDLGADIAIEAVKIKNRWCGDEQDDTGCLCRLSDAIITILDSTGTIVYGQQLGNTCGQPEIIISFNTVGSPTGTPTTSAEDAQTTDIPSVAPSPFPILLSPPSPKPTAKPTTKPTAKPTTKPTAKPTTKPTAKPTTKPTANPTTKPVAKSGKKTTPKPVANAGGTKK